MTHTENEDSGLYDQGLKSAFDQQAITVPDHMDGHILTTATKAINKVPGSQKTVQRRLEKYRPLLATAAMLMIGVGLLPIILENPESAVSYGLGLNDRLSNSRAINTEALYADTEETTAESQALAEDEMTQWLQSDETLLISDQALVAPEKAPAINELEQAHLNATIDHYPVDRLPTEIPTTRTSTDQITSVSASRASTGSNEVSTVSFQNVAIKPQASAFASPYHESSERWIAYIKVLLVEQKLKEARKEFELLRRSDLDLSKHESDQILTSIQRLEDFLTGKDVTQ